MFLDLVLKGMGGQRVERGFTNREDRGGQIKREIKYYALIGMEEINCQKGGSPKGKKKNNHDVKIP